MKRRGNKGETKVGNGKANNEGEREIDRERRIKETLTRNRG